MTAADEIRAASQRFYAALNRMAQGDAAPMIDAWSHGAGVSTMHPIGGREIGWEQVKGPWEQVATLSTGGDIGLEQQAIEVLGDAACETGVETGHIVLGGRRVAIEQRVTNVYHRETDGWKIVHHHADLSPGMLEALAALEDRG